ncbi:hypothetical protein RND81_14G151000 [Saponaria officinalis]|uniref:DUF7054 domain-containing protein n=1 Tax=Saponaria officinalis TaxID=3572 RepID=A0AAW1GQH7_SAPOF
MPSPRPHRNRTERSKSFNGRGAVAAMEELKRPRTVPDLRAAAVAEGGGGVAPKKVLTKVLMNVNIQGSVGAVQVLVSLENTVGELISAVVKQYLKEGRRPIILVNDVVHFDLHYSQFSLECMFSSPFYTLFFILISCLLLSTFHFVLNFNKQFCHYSVTMYDNFALNFIYIRFTLK